MKKDQEITIPERLWEAARSMHPIKQAAAKHPRLRRDSQASTLIRATAHIGAEATAGATKADAAITRIFSAIPPVATGTRRP